jgi:hypothetical protein
LCLGALVVRFSSEPPRRARSSSSPFSPGHVSASAPPMDMVYLHRHVVGGDYPPLVSVIAGESVKFDRWLRDAYGNESSPSDEAFLLECCRATQPGARRSAGGGFPP